MDLKQIIDFSNNLEVVEGFALQDHPEIVIELISKYDYTVEKMTNPGKKRIRRISRIHHLSLSEATIVSTWNKLKKNWLPYKRSINSDFFVIETLLRHLSKNSPTIKIEKNFSPKGDPGTFGEIFSRKIIEQFSENLLNMLFAIKEFSKTRVVGSLTEQSRRVCLKQETDWSVSHPHVKPILLGPFLNHR